MSVILEQELIQGSHFTGNKVILEPILGSLEAIPFLDSQVLKPNLFKMGILQLNQVLITHPGIDLGYNYDPIVTVTENYVDFDGFAVFGHSYCKIRFPEKLFDGRIKQEGTTNIDFNPTFIQNLRTRRYTKDLWLYIDPDGVEFAIDSTSHYLKKIQMPNWWKHAYIELDKFIDRETLEPHGKELHAGDFNKVILSGKAFERLVHELNYHFIAPRQGVRTLAWNNKSIELVYSQASAGASTPVFSINTITPCENPLKTWGIWRIQNLSDIAEYIIQADVYLANKQPSFWVLHARSGVELLLGYTPYTSALWTEKARKPIEKFMKNYQARLINPTRGHRRRRYKPRNRPRSRINFVKEHPGQLTMSDFINS
ncbi:MAG: hypothetical protein ACTSQI_20215 [Candidatus Helarchaeota archaeon]